MTDVSNKNITLEQARLIVDRIPSSSNPLKPYEMDVKDRINVARAKYLQDGIDIYFIDSPTVYHIADSFDFVYYGSGTAPVSTDAAEVLLKTTIDISLEDLRLKSYSLKSIYITINGTQERLSCEKIGNSTTTPEYLIYSSSRDKDQNYLRLQYISGQGFVFYARTWWNADNEISIRCSLDLFHRLDEDSVELSNYAKYTYVDSLLATNEEFNTAVMSFKPSVFDVSAPETLKYGLITTVVVKTSIDVANVYVSVDNGDEVVLKASNKKAVKNHAADMYSFSVGIKSKLLGVGEHKYQFFATDGLGYKSNLLKEVLITVYEEA